MTVQIDPQINSFAKSAQIAYKIDKNVVLAHWMSEHPLDSLKNWQDAGNNPAGITPGNPTVDAMAIGTDKASLSPNGFLKFVTPLRGFQAYITLLFTDKNYAGVRDAVKTGDPKKELAAIAASGWDAGHYGGDGSKLLANYAAITGDSNVKTFTDQGAVMVGDTSTPQGADLVKQEAAKVAANVAAREAAIIPNFIKNTLGLKDVNFYTLGIVVLGSVGILIILLMLIKDTKSDLVNAAIK